MNDSNSPLGDSPQNTEPEQFSTPNYFTVPAEETPATPAPASVQPLAPLSAETPQPVPSPASPCFFARIARLGRKKILMLGGALVVLVGLGVGGFMLFSGGSILGESALEKAFRENSPYVYNAAQTNIDTKKKFTFKHAFATPTRTSTSDENGATDYLSRKEVSEYINVYSDPLLQHPASADVSGNKDSFTIGPSFSSTLNTPGLEGDPITIANVGEWGIHNQYYLAQFADLETGTKLEKPIVTPFSPKKSVDTPSVSFSITDQGSPSLSWTPIEGVDVYYVVKYYVSGNSSEMMGTVYEETTGTSWTLGDTKEYDGTIDKQNADFMPLDKTARAIDDTYSKDPDTRNAAEATLLSYANSAESNIYFGVIAKKDGKFSSTGTVDVYSALPQIPYKIAENYAAANNIGLLRVDGFDNIPTSVPIVTADMSIVSRPIKLDKSKARALTTLETKRVQIPYTVVGTKFTGNVYVANYPTNFMPEIDRIIARNNALTANNGGADSNSVLSTAINVNEIKSKASRTKPNLPYAINATNPLTEYIAANLLNGEKYIDVSEYTKGDRAVVDPVDAFKEAVFQNPLIQIGKAGGSSYASESGIYVIDYDTDKDTMQKRQKELDAKAKSIVASIIKPGMSDKDKVVAINQYIVKNTQYTPALRALLEAKSTLLSVAQYRQYSESWSAAGPLLKSDGVCMGYSEAFQLLANYSGLSSVVVTGYAGIGTVGHAWNKVKVDGAWRVVDTTWNDQGDTSSDTYLLLTDAQTNKLRKNVETTDWISDVLIKNYAAN